jgi:hypothetical protein
LKNLTKAFEKPIIPFEKAPDEPELSIKDEITSL